MRRRFFCIVGANCSNYVIISYGKNDLVANIPQLKKIIVKIIVFERVKERFTVTATHIPILEKVMLLKFHFHFFTHIYFTLYSHTFATLFLSIFIKSKPIYSSNNSLTHKLNL